VFLVFKSKGGDVDAKKASEEGAVFERSPIRARGQRFDTATHKVHRAKAITRYQKFRFFGRAIFTAGWPSLSTAMQDGWVIASYPRRGDGSRSFGALQPRHALQGRAGGGTYADRGRSKAVSRGAIRGVAPATGEVRNKQVENSSYCSCFALENEHIRELAQASTSAPKYSDAPRAVHRAFGSMIFREQGRSASSSTLSPLREPEAWPGRVRAGPQAPTRLQVAFFMAVSSEGVAVGRGPFPPSKEGNALPGRPHIFEKSPTIGRRVSKLGALAEISTVRASGYPFLAASPRPAVNTPGNFPSAGKRGLRPSASLFSAA